jgi:hypothetical protein
MFLKFESVSHPVRLAQGLKVLPHLVRVFARWPFREVPGSGSPMPQINVMQDGDSFVLQAPWVELERRYASATELAEGLVGHLAQARLREAPGHLLIEATAARFGDGLVVFVGGPGSGKSLLATCLAASRHKIYAASALLFDCREKKAITLGVAPRLSLPLAASLSGPLRQLMEIHTVRVTEHAYLKPEQDLLAAHGARAPIRGVVILDRREGADAALRPVAESTMLKRLMLGSSDGLSTSGETLDALQELVAGASRHRLTWSDPQQAVAALRGRFALRRAVGAEEETPPNKTVKRRQRRHTGPRTPAGRLFRHGAGLGERAVDNDLFLVDRAGEAVYHLNGLGAGMWRLLDGSHGLDDVVMVLRDAFPTVDRKLIEDDVEKLVGDLLDRGLLVEERRDTIP